MTGGILAAITAVFGVIAVLLEAWAQNSPKRKAEDRNEQIEKGRQDIANGNTDAVSVRVDRLCDSATAINTRDLGSDEDTKRRIDALTRG